MVNYSPAAGRKVKQASYGQSLQNAGLSRHCDSMPVPADYGHYMTRPARL